MTLLTESAAANNEGINIEAAEGNNDGYKEKIKRAIQTSLVQTKKIRDRYAIELTEIGTDTVNEIPLNESRVTDWIKSLYPNARKPKGPMLSKVSVYQGTRKEIRKQRYAHVQKTYKKDPGAAGRMVLNDNDLVPTRVPGKNEMFNFWSGVFDDGENHGKAHMKPLWDPITVEEIIQSRTSNDKAAGPDGIKPEKWNRMNVHVKCLLYNLFIFHEKVPKDVKVSRTVFLAKVDGGSSDPGDFRPLTICSVILREFHKILPRRLTTCHVYDERQTAYLPVDGVSVSVLTSVISEARRKKKELHIAILDLIKAFNSVYHSALLGALQEVGCPAGFINYVMDMYTDVRTELQFEGDGKITLIKVGVYQGDQLSGPLFTIAYESALKVLNASVGFDMEETRLNASAYSDDGILMAMTVFGLQENINKFSEKLAKIGLKINPRKSHTLSLVPSGRDKKMKVVSNKPFNVDDIPMSTLSVSDFWKYLGVVYDSKGTIKVKTTLSESLQKLTKGPLKPQQRLRFLKTLVIPGLQDKLILSRTTATGLKRMDVQIRECVRRWLYLPHDVPIAYLHAPVRAGGLGIPCLQLWIPLMRINRLRNIMKLDGDRIKAVMNCTLYRSIIHNSKQAISKIGVEDPKLADYHSYWRKALNAMVDAKDLKMAGNSTSTRMDEVLGEDFVHYNQMRSNSVPTRKRTARGRPRKRTTCRAGCRQVETLQHVIQNCERTHGTRILRHNRVVNMLAGDLRRKQYTVNTEVVIRTTQETFKPDIIAAKDNIAYILDVQVVKCGDLENDHARKVEKYRDSELLDIVKRRYNAVDVKNAACTISYKGIWSRKSLDELKRFGIKSFCLFKIVTSVLRGSWLCWRYFNRATTMFR